jgi:hypothetical protein
MGNWLASQVRGPTETGAPSAAAVKEAYLADMEGISSLVTSSTVHYNIGTQRPTTHALGAPHWLVITAGVIAAVVVLLLSVGVGLLLTRRQSR